jgi:hypothetical protein
MKLSKYIKSSILTAILFLCLVNFSTAATVSFFTPSKAYTVGSDIVLSIVVSSDSKPASAVSGLISFPTNLISVSSISTDDSIVSNWVQEPSFSNSTGHINFESLLVSGFTGNLGKIITITFKAKSAGTVNINFVAGSVVTVDGVNNDILSNSNNIIFSISKTTISKGVISNPVEEIKVVKETNTSPITKPDSSGWYSIDDSNLTRIPNYHKISEVLIASIILLIILILLMYYNFSGKNHKLKKEVYEAEDAIHKAFDILKDSEDEQIQILEKVNPKGKSIVKKKAKKQFKKDLDDAEKFIEKEINDIDKLVNKN